MLGGDFPFGQSKRAGRGRLTVQGPAGTRELPYDALLLGTGRKPNIDGLSLEAAGVRLGNGGGNFGNGGFNLGNGGGKGFGFNGGLGL